MDLWGRMRSGAAVANRRAGRRAVGPQVPNLPHGVQTVMRVPSNLVKVKPWKSSL